MNCIWTEFQDNVRYTGKMVSGYSGFTISLCFPIKMHGSGPKKKTWYNAEELKLETNTVLNSPIGIQLFNFPNQTKRPQFYLEKH